MEAAFPFRREDLPAHVLCVSRLSSLELPLGGGSAGLEHPPSWPLPPVVNSGDPADPGGERPEDTAE